MDIKNMETKIISVRNEDVKGVYTYDEYIEKNIGSTKNLRKRRFERNQLEMAKAWSDGICVSDFVRKEKGFDAVADSKSNLVGLKELRRLLSEKNIVTGYYKRCKHEDFKMDVSYYPCPWDKRVLRDGHGDVCKQCSKFCTLDIDKIIANKERYLNCIDKLICNLEKDPLWHKGYGYRDGIQDISESKSNLKIYTDIKDVKDEIDIVCDDMKNGRNTLNKLFFQLGIQEILFYEKDVSDKEANAILEQYSDDSRKWYEIDTIYSVNNTDNSMYAWVREVNKIIFEVNPTTYRNYKRIAKILANKMARENKTQYMYYIQSTLKSEHGNCAVLKNKQMTKDYTDKR